MKIKGNILPGNEKLLVKILKEEKDDSKIYLPDQKDQELLVGEVKSVGEAKHNDSTRRIPAAGGDKVLFEKWAGKDITLGEDEHKIINFDDVVAIIV